VRDRRWDFLHDVEKQPVKDWILERFAAELARDLEGWPPPFEAYVADDLRRRWAAGLGRRPPVEVLRLAMELARLDLGRDVEAYEERMRNAAPRACRDAADEAALHLVALLVSEECLDLKERAEAARLTRADLSRAVAMAERLVFRPATR
jgi:hypothetical protein